MGLHANFYCGHKIRPFLRGRIYYFNFAKMADNILKQHTTTTITTNSKQNLHTTSSNFLSTTKKPSGNGNEKTSHSSSSSSSTISGNLVSSIIDPKLNYYEILKVPVTASHKQIKAAYYTMSKIYHPDRHLLQQQQHEETLEQETQQPQAETGDGFGSENSTLTPDECSQIFRRITEAYDCLSNERKRQRYDYALHRKKYSSRENNNNNNPAMSMWGSTVDDPPSSSSSSSFHSPKNANNEEHAPGASSPGEIDFDSLDDEVLRELIRYERLRRFGRSNRMNRNVGFASRYESWLKERKRKNSTSNAPATGDSSTNTAADFESYFDYVKRKQKEMDEFLNRDPWKSSCSNNDGNENNNEPRNCTQVEWAPREVDQTITYNPLWRLAEVVRRKVGSIRIAMADKENFNYKLMIYVIGISMVIPYLLK